MKKKILSILTILFAVVLIFTGCSKKNESTTTTTTSNEKIKIVTTTTMLKDLIENIGGDNVEVEGLMGEGVDPHLYKPTATDVEKLNKADVIVYQGLHLEGQMTEIFSKLSNKKIIEVGNGIAKDKLLKDEEGSVDPHIWFDVELWGSAGKYITDELGKFYTDKKVTFEDNYKKYKLELDNLHKYVVEKTNSIPKEQRVLVTAHDAFSYFAEKYGYEVLAIQGISTETEATTADISKLADELSTRKIKAIFIESSVPEKTVKALEDAVKSKGHEIVIGGELFSDSLGDKATNSETYIGTVKYNINTISKALQ